ncbi:hypothetical protein D3C86_2111020 [compost metagenome]
MALGQFAHLVEVDLVGRRHYRHQPMALKVVEDHRLGHQMRRHTGAARRLTGGHRGIVLEHVVVGVLL